MIVAFLFTFSLLLGLTRSAFAQVSGQGINDPRQAVGAQGTQESAGSIFDQVDPLKQDGSDPELAEQLSTPGGIISRLMSFAFPLAGMILFVMILIGGFQMLAGGGEQKSMEAGRQRVTFAVIGFLLLFSSYWIAQILETLLNIKIL